MRKSAAVMSTLASAPMSTATETSPSNDPNQA
jgi:hypothetical protein